jgi:hypothetical protein
MKRLLGGLLALVVLLAAGLFGGAVYMERAALDALRDMGARWDRVERGAWGWRVHEVAWRGARASTVTLLLEEPTTLQVDGVDLDLAAFTGGVAALEMPTGVETASELPAAIGAAITDLRLRVGEQVLAEGLSGTARVGPGEPPSIVLSGEGTQIQAPGPAGERALVHLERPLELEYARGDLAIDVSVTEADGATRLTLRARADALRLRHDLLAKRALTVADWRLDLAGPPEALSGRLSASGVVLDLALDCDAAPPRRCALTAEMPDMPASEALAPFAPIAPEIDRARIGGTIGGSLTYAWPEGTWAATPRIRALAVEGTGAQIEDLRGGRFTYLAAGAAGERAPRRSGEGSRGWLPLASVSDHVPRAVMAAEDAAFYSHRGYDESAIAEALADAATDGDLRGGSTLTQQLVKNLFLDPDERTIARKLRELLIAAELHRALGARRVMELYLNVVEFGPEVWGIGPASDYYFLKKAKYLKPNEAAFLALLLPAPKTYHDYWFLTGRPSRVRIQGVLSNMADAKWITRAEANRWGSETLRMVPPPK